MSNQIETLEFHGGEHIQHACEKAAARAVEISAPVRFVFNDTEVIAQPGEDAETLMARWDDDSKKARQAWLASPEYAKREADRKAEHARRIAAHLVETAQTETEMREAADPRPYTLGQLTEYVQSLTNRQHDYGTCVYAMSLAAVAAFNYVAGVLGVTGFQASCADMNILTRTRHMKGPWLIIKAEDALYPQYDLPGRLAEALREWRPWLAEQATKFLSERGHAHSNVIAHWKELAGTDNSHSPDSEK